MNTQLAGTTRSPGINFLHNSCDSRPGLSFSQSIRCIVSVNQQPSLPSFRHLSSLRCRGAAVTRIPPLTTLILSSCKSRALQISRNSRTASGYSAAYEARIRTIRRRMADAASQDGSTVSQAAGQRPMMASKRDKEAGVQQPKRAYFPLGYREGFSQWWQSISPATAEHKVLSFVPYLQQPPTQQKTGTLASAGEAADGSTKNGDDVSQSASLTKLTSEKDPYGPRKWHSSLVKLAGKNRALNEFSVERVGEEVEQNLVMLHGYGAGLGFFYKNFEPLSRVPNWRLYALDLLGMGRSSRPAFKINAKDRQGSITEAENWFIDALEEWRKERQIERFTLLGHSLGGYMAVAYALKYPGHLNKLILASPVGVPEDPYAVAADLPEPGDSSMAAEVMQDQTSTTAQKGDNNNFLNARSNATTSENDKEPRRRPLPKWLVYLWDANISPFSLVRWSGPFGPRLVSGWTTRRFSQMPAEEAQALHDYAYSLFRQRGSGEYALAYILAPGAFARSPLIRRIGGVGHQLLPPGSPSQTSTQLTETQPLAQLRERGVPVVLMYGDSDWMDVGAGYDAVEKLNEAREQATRGMSRGEKAKEQGDAKVLIVKKAGHHVYLDGWQEFNEMIRLEMKDVERRELNR